MGGEEGAVDLPVPPQHMRDRKGERRIAARERLQMEMGRRGGRMLHRIDDDDLRIGLADPVLVLMRRRGMRVGAPDQNGRGVLRHARIEAYGTGAVHIAERGMAGCVADRIRIDLAGAEPVQEPLREASGDERAGSGVMAVPDARRIVLCKNPVQSPRDLCDRMLPCDRLETRLALRAGPLHGLSKAHFGVEPGAVVGYRAFAAECAAADRMVGIAQHLDLAVCSLCDRDPAGVVTVARASGANDLRWRHDALSEVVGPGSGGYKTLDQFTAQRERRDEG